MDLWLSTTDTVGKYGEVDQHVIAFGLVMGFVGNKENKEKTPALSFNNTLISSVCCNLFTNLYCQTKACNIAFETQKK